MTYISIQTSPSSKKIAFALLAEIAQSTASVISALLSPLFAKRAFDADSVLSAQARQETARRNVDNLLR